MPDQYAAQKALEASVRSEVKADAAMDGIHRINGNIATFANAMEKFRDSVSEDLTEMTRQITKVTTQLAIAGVIITLFMGTAISVATYYLTSNIHHNHQLIQKVQTTQTEKK